MHPNSFTQHESHLLQLPSSRPYSCLQLPFAACLTTALQLHCACPSTAFSCLSQPAGKLPFGCLLQAGHSTPPCTEASPEVPPPYVLQAQAQARLRMLPLHLPKLKAAPRAAAAWQMPWPSAPLGVTPPWPVGRVRVRVGTLLQVGTQTSSPSLGSCMQLLCFLSLLP